MWYEKNQEERISEYFSKYTIKDFLTWWQNSTKNVMEIRIMDYLVIQQIAKELHLAYSRSGIYIQTEYELKQVIRHIRANNVIAWFGINPRKRSLNNYGNKTFGGKDVNVESLNFIFIDIDRINKIGEATSDDLKKADALSSKILERLKAYNWDERYLKICSGNGVQLIIALDVPIKMPNQVYDLESKSYDIDEEFEQLKGLVRAGIGHEILTFCKKYKDEFNVIVDKSVFNISSVASLPFTKNFKYGGFTWRGILDMKSGENKGLSDHCLLKVKNVKQWKQQDVFINHKTNHKNLIKSDELFDHPLVKFMLDNNLPHGQINNLLWMQMKCLLRDSKLTLKDDNVKELHKQMQKKYNDVFPMNIPDKKYQFKEDMINRYCANNLIPPLYPLNKLRVIKEPFNIEGLDWNMRIYHNDEYVLEGEDIFDDMKLLKKKLIDVTVKNGKGYYTTLVYRFINACVKKYGEDQAKYFFQHWLERYVGWRVA